jgi:predicted RNA-binding Zn ribbon-like protein
MIFFEGLKTGMTTKMAAHDWKDGFLFLGNDLALDFINTRPVQDGVPRELLPDFDALLRWFVAAGQINSRTSNTLRKKWETTRQAAAIVEAMRGFRERLRKAVLAWAATGSIPAATVDELNRLLAEYPMRTRLRSATKGTSTEQFFEVQHAGDLFAPLAYSAATLVATADRGRIRQCASCVLLFRDVSKRGMRHWCSMQLCGNRVKVAAYAERQRRRQ